MRKGSANTQRGAVRFIDELVARVRRAGASGELTVRVDSGFWSNDTITAFNRLDVRYTMAVRCATKGIADAIAAIPETAWTEIDYTPDGQAQVADCAYTTGTGRNAVTRRLVVRRTRLTGRAQQRLWPDWRHHAFLTDLDGTRVEVDRFHRHHAVVELAIRDLKEGAGLEHVPSGNFHANSAWLQCAVLAHNLIRWTTICGDARVDDQLIVARTIRTRLLALPGTDRQPRWPTNTATPHQLAMGRHVHHRARHAPRPAPRTRLTTAPRSGAPHHPTSADNPDRTTPASPRPEPSTPDSSATPTPPTLTPHPHQGPIGGSRLSRHEGGTLESSPARTELAIYAPPRRRPAQCRESRPAQRALARTKHGSPPTLPPQTTVNGGQRRGTKDNDRSGKAWSKACSVAFSLRALGRIRTCAHGSGDRRSIVQRARPTARWATPSRCSAFTVGWLVPARCGREDRAKPPCPSTRTARDSSDLLHTPPKTEANDGQTGLTEGAPDEEPTAHHPW